MRSLDSATPASSVLDRDTLAILESMLPFSNIESLIALFFSEADGHLSRILAAERRRDLTALAREAHSMVSSAGNVGALELSDLARALEHACKEGRAASTEGLVCQLIEACSAATIALKAWLNERRCTDAQMREADPALTAGGHRAAV